MIKSIEYSEFSLKFHETALRNDIPLDGAIELTSRCNLVCKHCYIRDNTGNEELTFEETCRIIDEITDAGCLWLLLTGGEPLLRQDFNEIYIYAKKKGLIITLFTNGALIDESIAALLKKLPPFSVEVTLYGATKETYECFTGVNGSYDACINGIRLLIEHKIPLELKTMVTTINKHDLAGMKKFANSLGLRFRYDPTLNPRLDGSKSPYDIRITPNEIVELDITDKDRLRAWLDLYREFDNPASGEYLFNCGAGRSSFHITSDGRLRVCELVPEPDFDLKNNRFMDGYRMFGIIGARKLKGRNTCARCNYIVFCNNCPGISMLEGDKSGESPVDYHCEVSRKRAEYIKGKVTGRTYMH